MIDEGYTEESPSAAEKKRPGAFWRELPILLGVAILVAVLVRTFVLQTFYIPSESMEHTLNINDKVLVNKLVYDFREPHRGEIVVFVAPDEWRSRPEDKDYIKRIIGTPGDRIECCDAQQRIKVNGHPLDEPYIYADGAGTRDAAADKPFSVVVPPNRLWVMGDHRSESGDSLQHYEQTEDIELATIDTESVIGRAFVLFWPMSRATWLSVPHGFDGVPAPAA